MSFEDIKILKEIYEYLIKKNKFKYADVIYKILVGLP